jgi:hypothetical protein
VKYIVAINGSFYPVDGTSASCPVVAGMVSLVNSDRMKAGKPSIGWMNPAIYSSSFHGCAKDVTTGENKCLRAEDKDSCCSEGFQATRGWDPVTGWGSVDFEKFRNFFLALKVEPGGKKMNSFDIWWHRFSHSYVMYFLAFVAFCLSLLACYVCSFISGLVAAPSSTPQSPTYGSVPSYE